MKLLLIITDYGSYNNFLVELGLKFASNNKNELHVICSRDKVINIEEKNSSKRNNIFFHFAKIPRGVNFINQIRAARQINDLIDLIKPDLIHSHFTTATFPTVLFRKRKYQYWATIHGLGMNSSSGLKKIIFTIVETICFLRLNRIFVVNNEDYNLLKKRFNEKLTKYKCFGFGCDIQQFNPNKFTNSKNELKSKLQLNEQSMIIAFTGRFVHFKGFNLVIKAFRKLIEDYPGKFKLILMGGLDPLHKTGLNEDEQLFYETNSDILNIGFTNHVDQYLLITDVFLFPSKKEGLPTCILEALAMGVPTITFNTRGNNDVIKTNYNGVLLDVFEDSDKEIDEILTSVIRLGEDFAAYKQFKANALKDREKYSRERFVNEQIESYLNFESGK